jgi:hypothetical protein
MRWWWQKPQLNPQEFLAETAKLLEVEFRPLVLTRMFVHDHAMTYMASHEVQRVVAFIPRSDISFLTPMALAGAHRDFTSMWRANPGVAFQFVLATGMKVPPYYPDITLGSELPFSVAGSLTEPVDAFYYLRNLPVRGVPPCVK